MPVTHKEPATNLFAELLKKAKRENRSIVPIIGAGLSADSGFPVITSIVRYFGKLDQYIYRNAYLPAGTIPPKQHQLKTSARGREDGLLKEGKPGSPGDPLYAIDREYKTAPWKYVRDFGWPDRFQLNEELYARLRKLKLEDADKKKILSDVMVACAVRTGLDASLSHFNEPGSDKYNELRRDIKTILSGSDPKKDAAKKPSALLQALLKKIEGCRPASRYQTLAGDVRKISDVFDGIAADIKKRLVETSEHKSVAFDVSGNWQKLIQYFTDYQSDYADSLFARFGTGRDPNRGHRFLAFLLKALDVSTIFTFNFDPMIEEVLISENLDPLVFSMERGESLPHPTLLRNRLSVIKMHGSTHALLLDEQLDRPLSRDYLDRFDEIVGLDPLLIVIGCSGGDSRLRDLVRHTLRPKSKAAVHWLHYEEKSPAFLSEFSGRPDVTLTVQQTNNLGMTLMHIHALLTGVNPASHRAYLAHTDLPIQLGRIADEEKAQLQQIDDRQIVLLHSLSLTRAEALASKSDDLDALIRTYKNPKNSMPAGPAPVPATDFPKYSASERLLLLANRWARWGHQVVWVDLEDSSTLAGVVSSIIDQCRKYDSELPPIVLAVDKETKNPASAEDRELYEDTLDLAVEKVTRALRRTRYFLAFDGLEAYVWPISAHHGMTHGCAPDADVRLAKLVRFLEKLTDPRQIEELGESRVAISVDAPKSRYLDLDRLKQTDCLEVQVAWLKNQWQAKKAPRRSKPPFSWSKDKPALADLISLTDVFVHSPVTPGRAAGKFEPSAGLPLIGLKNVARGKTPPDARDASRFDQTLFLLSCFRRIRPLALLRQVLEPLWGTREEVDEVLTELHEAGKSGRMLRQLEGGGYLFRRALRDHVYEQNTWFTGADSLAVCLDFKKSGQFNAERWKVTTFQLLFTGLTQQQIARAWYSATFVQSQDTFAFLEYTYHRLSSIRSFTKLLALARKAISCRKAGELRPAQALFEAIDRCRALIETAASPAGQRIEYEIPLGTDDELAVLIGKGFVERNVEIPAVEDILDRLQASIQMRHLQELQRFRHGWTRSEMILRRQVPAQHLLVWCKQLITEDLRCRCNQVVIRYGKGGFNPKYYPFEDDDARKVKETIVNVGGARKGKKTVVDAGDAQKEIDTFVDFLEGLQAKIWIERSDYRAVESERKRQSRKTSEEIKKIGARSTTALPLHARVLHQRLDLISSALKRVQEATLTAVKLQSGIVPLERDLREVLLDIDVAEKLNKGCSDETRFAGDLHEARLRCLTLQTQCAQRQVSVFTHNGFAGSQDDVKSWLPCAQEAASIAGEGLECIRGQDPHTLQSPRGVVVDPTADGTFYLQYRALFYMLRGRTQWMTEEDPQMLNPSTDKFVGTCEGALRDFETARGGLGGHNNLVAALVDLYAAEACLARARIRLNRDALRKSRQEYPALLREADSYHNSARSFLQHARQLLISSRRNTIWWKLFFRLITQYHSDRLLLNYARAIDEHQPGWDKAEARVFFNAFLTRLRKGYQTLRTACDYYQPRRVKEVPMRWIRRMWWEMTLCAYAAGRLLLHEHKFFPCITDAAGQELPHPDEPSAHDRYVTDQLKWLSVSAGLYKPGKHPLPLGFLRDESDYDTIEHLEGFLHLGADEYFHSGVNPDGYKFFECNDPIRQRLCLIETARRRVEGEDKWASSKAEARCARQRAAKTV